MGKRLVTVGHCRRLRSLHLDGVLRRRRLDALLLCLRAKAKKKSVKATTPKNTVKVKAPEASTVPDGDEPFPHLSRLRGLDQRHQRPSALFRYRKAGLRRI